MYSHLHLVTIRYHPFLSGASSTTFLISFLNKGETTVVGGITFGFKVAKVVAVH